jgi:glycosyltransferase involved in cell wall biosynthesis
MGGCLVNPRLAFLVPGPIATRTGGFIYDRRMIEGLRQLGWAVDVWELDETFPLPTDAALAHAASVLRTVADGGVVVVDGLALGAMPEFIEREASRLRIAALVHLPLAADVTRDRDTALRLGKSERRALAASALVVVTSPATVPMLAGYELSRDRITVAEPGTDPAPLARGSTGPSVQLLCVAAVHPGKGHDVLLRALADIPHDNWTLTCAGSVTRDRAFVDRVRGLARALGLEDRIVVAGELDAGGLRDRYGQADLFVLATLQETYGMAVAEALAHGLPVVGTTTGAIPALVGDDAGLLVPPGNSRALASALTRVIGDADLRSRLAEGARRVRDRLPTWEDAAKRLSAVLAPLTSRPGATSAASHPHG